MLLCGGMVKKIGHRLRERVSGPKGSEEKGRAGSIPVLGIKNRFVSLFLTKVKGDTDKVSFTATVTNIKVLNRKLFSNHFFILF